MLSLKVFPKVAVIKSFFNYTNLLLYRGIIIGSNADQKITRRYYMECSNFKLKTNVKLNKKNMVWYCYSQYIFLIIDLNRKFLWNNYYGLKLRTYWILNSQHYNGYKTKGNKNTREKPLVLQIYFTFLNENQFLIFNKASFFVLKMVKSILLKWFLKMR